MTHASAADSPLAVDPALVRLSVGIETADDLVADLRQALDRRARLLTHRRSSVVDGTRTTHVRSSGSGPSARRMMRPRGSVSTRKPSWPEIGLHDLDALDASG